MGVLMAVTSTTLNNRFHESYEVVNESRCEAHVWAALLCKSLEEAQENAEAYRDVGGWCSIHHVITVRTVVS